MSHLLKQLLICLPLMLAGGNVVAEEIRIPLGQQGSTHLSDPRPALGMTMEAVRAQFGQPESEEPAVGTPPITRWHYRDYMVIFEHNHVIHSVLKPVSPVPQGEPPLDQLD